MTIEILRTAKVLAEKIAIAERRVDEWQNFSGIKDGKVEGDDMYYAIAPGTEKAVQDFNLKYWQRELEQLQREFDAL